VSAAAHEVLERTSVRVLQIEEAREGKGPVITAQLIRAGMSLNRRRYPDTVLATAAPLYAGVKVMLDHADGWLFPDSVRNVAAIVTDPKWDEGEKALVGRIHPATDLESGRVLLDLARTEQAFRRDGILGDEDHLFGFSHRAMATGEYREPEDAEPYYEVSAITDVISVDAVVFPAAGGLMRGLSESRRDQLLALLGEAGIRPAPSPEGSARRAKARGKVSIMAKVKGARAFDTSGIVIQAEGIERKDLEPALQAAAQVGHDLATAEADERLATLEGDVARLTGERDGIAAKLREYQEREEAAARLAAIDTLMAEREVPEMARPALRERILRVGDTPERAGVVIDAYLEGLKARREGVVEDADTPASVQQGEGEDPVAIGLAFYEQWSGVTPTDN
jgi:hypothetical protein